MDHWIMMDKKKSPVLIGEVQITEKVEEQLVFYCTIRW